MKSLRKVKKETQGQRRRRAKKKAQKESRKNIIGHLKIIKAKWEEMLAWLPDKEKHAATVEYLEERIAEVQEAMWPNKEWKPGEMTEAFIALQDCQLAFLNSAIKLKEQHTFNL